MSIRPIIDVDFMKKSFSYRAAPAWNNLPSDILQGYESFSVPDFKILINNYWSAV